VTARRAKGTGSITELRDGTFRGSYAVGYTKSGGIRRISVTGKSRTAVEAKLKKLIRDVTQNGPPTAGKAVNVKAWADEWLTREAARVRPKTYKGYRTNVNLWIIPTIGHRRLTELTPADVRAVTNALKKAGSSTTTQRGAQTVLKLLLGAAVKEGHAVPAWVLTVDPPARAVHDRGEIQLADLAKLQRTAAAMPNGAGSRWIAAWLLGLRQSEALGLTWDCVDTVRGVAEISWQLQALPYATKGKRSGPLLVPDGYEYRQLYGALCLVRPKTGKGLRLVPLFADLRDALAALPRTHELVWPVLRMTKRRTMEWLPQAADDDEAAFRALQDAAKVRHPSGRYYLLHEARHTTATLLLALHVEEDVRIGILGHASITTTRQYQHVSVDMAREALDSLGRQVRELEG
jgi:integrase